MQFTQEQLQELLKTDSKNIASLIVINRILGGFKEETKFCMIELMKRKINGDTFDFESFINESLEKYNIKINIPDFKSMKFEMSKMISDTFVSTMMDLNKTNNANSAESIDEDDDEFE